MTNVGLLYVGAVLIVNGLMLLDRVSPRAAAPLNLFVGTLQIVIPTVLLVTGEDSTATIAAASGLYLFGFTYLWVGINAVTGWTQEGLGWYSLFVAIAAVGYAIHTWSIGGRIFVVLWLAWSVLWLLLFLVFGLGYTSLTRFTAGVAIAEGILAATLPAGFALAEMWRDSTAVAIVGAVTGCCVLIVLWLIARQATQSVCGAGALGEKPAPKDRDRQVAQPTKR